MAHSTGLGRTVRDEFNAALGEDNLGGISYARNKAALEFYGITTTTTQTEIFINNKGAIASITDSAKRLYFPAGGAAGFDVRFMAVNTTTQAVVCAGTGFVAAARTLAGNVTLAANASGTPIAGNTNSTNPSFVYNVGNTAVANIAFVANTTLQALTCLVTAPAAQRTIWKVALVPVFSCTERSAGRFFGDSGLGDSLES
jgi:hypothetical protein